VIGLKVGVSVHESLMVADGGRRRALLDAVVDAGLDHVTVGDHISFHGGTGFDGLLSATAVLAANDTLDVLVGVYQVALRHPLVTARQVASLSELAPGRLVLGVGVGGEDRREVSNCGVDPSTRGRRVDECLTVLRQLAGGDPVDHDGEFFTLHQAAILPAPSPRVPLVVGGAGDVAVRRTAAYGDGWLGLFCSARRFADTRAQILEVAAAAGRQVDWFGLSVWCAFGDDPQAARAQLGDRMQALYNMPAEKFQHVSTAGDASSVAEFLAPYVAAGARHLTLVPADDDPQAGIAGVAEVKRLLDSV
jgi:alkanesulfonate monooxygenase SsuD/methylene tetrahydromethanopterin reductase-like flavin-dependent oxidoreductase (luciferase family)